MQKAGCVPPPGQQGSELFGNTSSINPSCASSKYQQGGGGVPRNMLSAALTPFNFLCAEGTWQDAVSCWALSTPVQAPVSGPEFPGPVLNGSNILWGERMAPLSEVLHPSLLLPLRPTNGLCLVSCLYPLQSLLLPVTTLLSPTFLPLTWLQPWVALSNQFLGPSSIAY